MLLWLNKALFAIRIHFEWFLRSVLRNTYKLLPMTLNDDVEMTL